METAGDRLHDMGEHISPDRFGVLTLNALTPDYNFARKTSFKDREFGLEDIKFTMRNMYADLLSRSSITPSIAGRVVAMQAQEDLSGVQCYTCSKFGRRTADCPKYDSNYNKTKRKKDHPKQETNHVGGGPIWSSVHLTTSHSDDECKLQKRQANNGNANFTMWTSSNTSLQRRGSRVFSEDFRS